MLFTKKELKAIIDSYVEEAIQKTKEENKKIMRDKIASIKEDYEYKFSRMQEYEYELERENQRQMRANTPKIRTRVVRLKPDQRPSLSTGEYITSEVHVKGSAFDTNGEYIQYTICYQSKW